MQTKLIDPSGQTRLLPYAGKPVRTPPKRAPVARPAEPHRFDGGSRAEISPDLKNLIAEFLPAERRQILSALASEFPLHATALAEAPAGVTVTTRKAFEVFGQLNYVEPRLNDC